MGSLQQATRADYLDRARRRGSMMRGGGDFGKAVRILQRSQRDAARRNLANQLAPLEARRARLDTQIAVVEKALLQVETYILENK